MVSPVQVHVVGVEQKVGKQEDDHFSRLFPSVHKVAIKHILCLSRRKAVLNIISAKKQHTVKLKGLSAGLTTL